MADRETAAQRLDKWLWFARLTRTRSLAAKLVAEGFVRVNSRRVTAPAKNVAPGDVLTVALHRQVRVLKVASLGTRRASAAEAAHLFQDLTVGPEVWSKSSVRAGCPRQFESHLPGRPQRKKPWTPGVRRANPTYLQELAPEEEPRCPLDRAACEKRQPVLSSPEGPSK